MLKINTEEVVKKYYEEKQSLETIASQYNCSIWAIQNRVSKFGKIRPKHNSVCDHDIFEKIDTEEKAYWLGFLAADGCIFTGQGKNVISLVLGIEDKIHVEKFKDFVGSSNKILDRPTTGYNSNSFSSSFSFSSPKVVKDLSNFGIISRKSFLDEHEFNLNNIPNELLRHYWRGMIDGDGFITISSRPQFKIGLTGSYSTIKQFKEYCQQLTNTNAGIRKHYSIYQITISSSHGIKIAELLYDNANIFLQRKYNKINNYKNVKTLHTQPIKC